MITQKEFFELICTNFATKAQARMDIAEHFDVSPETVKKWMYGNVSLNFSQVRELVTLFDIAPQDLFTSQKEFVGFRYISLKSGNPEDYKKYITGLAELLEEVAEQPDAKVFFKADEVPLFYLFPFPNLSYYRLYTYGCNMYDYEMKFEEFVRQMIKLDVEPIFNRIQQAYSRIEGEEVWDNYVLESVLRDIEDMYRINRFEDRSTAIQLLDETTVMIENFLEMVESRKKETGVKFVFYKQDSPIRMGLMFVEYKDKLIQLIKLDTINSMSTDNRKYTSESFKAYKASIEHSISLEKGSKKERTLYFRRLLNRINTVRKRISKD